MTRRLPRSLDELRGLRAARWTRESTPGQFDRYGPEAQREQQDLAVGLHGLVDTGLSWTIARSGRTVGGSPEFAAMIGAAGVDYDVLVVGYVSRFARDVRTAVNARHDLHLAGAAILFCDERVLTSDEDSWEAFAREAVEAESYSRRLAKRIREGYAAKLRRLGDPGGNPPFGFRRDADKLLEPDPMLAGDVRRIFDLAAARLTDREVAERVGLTIHVVRGTLRNPLYAGRLPDGRPTRFRALVSPALWNEVQAVRERRRTRDGRPARQGEPYALSMLHCAACGRHLIGDTGRYRHVDPCPTFLGAVVQPRRRVRGQHTPIPGHSYARHEYEGAIAKALERASLGADVVAQVVADTRPAEPDRLTLARVERERGGALERYRVNRDAGELERTMARLDTEALIASIPDAVPSLPADEAVAYLRDLPRLWADAPRSRRAIAEALFERIEVLGMRSIRIHPTAAAVDRGLADAFRTGSGGYGRGGGI